MQGFNMRPSAWVPKEGESVKMQVCNADNCADKLQEHS